MTIGAIPDKRFGDPNPLILMGDFAILARTPTDDYIRPADMRTNCHTLNTPNTQPDDLSEPNRFLHQHTIIENNRWKLTTPDAFVKTNYNCFPTGGDFATTAHLEITGVHDTTTQPPTPPYLIDGIALTYGCCFGTGIGYARWNPNHYKRVIFGYHPNDLLVIPYNSNTYIATIHRQNGTLYLMNSELEIGTYTLPEPMSIRRITLEVRP